MKLWRLKRLWLLLCAPLGGVLALAAYSSAFAEWYATTIYPALSLAGNFLSGLVPFSVMELMLALLILGAPAYLVFQIVRLVRKKDERRRSAVRFAATPLCLAAVLFLCYMLNCGVNYHRLTFAETCGLAVRPSSVQELVKLCESLALESNAQRELVPEDDGVAAPDGGFADTAQQAKTAFSALKLKYPLLTGGYGAPKPVLFSKIMSYCDITGIFWPFAFEANVNADVPAYTQPATMCHELSHLRGYMREDEANFIGVLACAESESPSFRYSGAVLSYVYASNALYASSPEEAARISSTLSEGVRRDMQASGEYWQQFDTPVRAVAGAVNDSYLKSNRQEDGVQSYGRIVDLLLALQREK